MIYNVELKRTFRVTTVVFWLKMGNLKKLREKKKLSQGQLSIRSGVNLQTIKAYEQRTRNINLNICYKYFIGYLHEKVYLCDQKK